MANQMRVWVVTALNEESKFIDQRRIEAPNQATAESYAYDWIRRVGGSLSRSILKEVSHD